MSQTEREQTLAVARDAVLAALPRARAIYVYGSFARGDQWPDSDVDLAVLLPPGHGVENWLDVVSRVSGRVHREVDLVDLRRASDVLRREVLSEGQPLHVSEPDQVLAWEASAMSRYARHREEIREILEESAKPGSRTRMNEVLAQKVASLQRCVTRAREARAEAGAEFRTRYNLQDAAVLNIIRACDTAIDLANMLIRRRQLGIPAESRDSFSILVREKIIAADLGERLQRMVGFRNVAVHQYRDLEMEIVEAVIARHLDDLLQFVQTMLAQMMKA